MSVELATAYVSVVPSTRGMSKQLQAQMGGPAVSAGEASGKQMGGAMAGGIAGAARRMIAPVAAIVGGIGIARVGKEIGGVATSAQRTEASLSALYEAAGHGAEEATVATRLLWDQFGRSSLGLEAFQGGAESLAYLGLNAEESVGVMSFLEDAILATGGSSQEMERVTRGLTNAMNRNKATNQELQQISGAGVPIYDMLAAQLGVTTGAVEEMAASGEISVDDLTDALQGAPGTWAPALREGADAVRNTLPVAWDSAKNTVVNAIAKNIMPLVDRLAPVMVRFGDIAAGAIEGFAAVVEWAGPVVSGLAKPVGIIAGVILASYVPAMVTAAATTVSSMATKMAAWVAGRVQVVANAVRMAAAWVTAMGPVGWVIATVTGLVALIVANWDTVVEWTRQAWDWIVGAVVDAWEWIVGAVSDAVDAVVGFVSTLWTSVTDWVSRLVTDVVGFFADLWATVTTWVSDLVTDVIEFFRGLWEGTTGWVSSLVTDVVGFFVDLWTRVTGWVSDLVSSVVGFFTDMHRDVTSWVSDLVGSVVGFFVDLWTRATGWVRDLFDAVIAIFSNLYDGVTEVVGDLIEAVVEWFEELPGRIWDAIKGIPGMVAGIFQSIWDGFTNLFSGDRLRHRLVDDIVSQTGRAKSDIERELGISSPSKVWMEVGQSIPDGFRAGVLGGVDGALGELERFATVTAVRSPTPDRPALHPIDLTLDLGEGITRRFRLEQARDSRTEARLLQQMGAN